MRVAIVLDMGDEQGDPEYWRKRAAEALAMSEAFTNVEAKALMQQVAKSFETIAKITAHLKRRP